MADAKIGVTLVGDSRDAVRAFDDVTAAAKRAEQAGVAAHKAFAAPNAATRVANASPFQGLSSSGAQGGLQSVMGAFGVSGGPIAGLAGDIGSAGIYALPAVLIASFAKGAVMVGAAIDKALGRGINLGGATSATDEARRLEQTGASGLGDVARGLGAQVAGPAARLFGIKPPRQRDQDQIRANIRALFTSNPAALQAALPYLNADEQAYARQQMGAGAAVAQFQANLPKYQPQITINAAVVDPNGGESLRAVMDRAARNNGRSATYTKP
jgi:hypothetical protein